MARFEWSEEAQLAFETLKKALVEATYLAFPVPQEPCVLDTDASDVAMQTTGPMFDNEIKLGQGLNPSSQDPFRPFKCLKPFQTVMVCSL